MLDEHNHLNLEHASEQDFLNMFLYSIYLKNKKIETQMRNAGMQIKEKAERKYKVKIGFRTKTNEDTRNGAYCEQFK